MRLGQYRIYSDEEVPICYASWALLSDELSEGYKNNTYKIQAQDWNSGNNLWLINVLCPKGGGSIVLRRLDKLRKEMGLSFAAAADLQKTIPTHKPPTGGGAGFGKGKAAGKGKGKKKKN